MYIHGLAHYIPEKVIDNEYFSNLLGISEEEIIKKSGIKQRRKASAEENTNTMAIEAVKELMSKTGFDSSKIDLIVGATYSPYDTVTNISHVAQHYLQISEAIVFNVCTACSSFINAMESVSAYFSLGKAKIALVIASEHNNAYNNESDPYSGFLWGDGAAALIVTKDKTSDNDIEIVDIITKGYGHFPKAMDSVNLKPLNGGIKMNNGRDVFINATKIMSNDILTILQKNGYSVNDLNYVIPHQANLRIINTIADMINFNKDNLILNIQKFGNTGCASSAIALSEAKNIFKKGDIAAVVVFGGGYSSGCMLLRKN